MAYEKGKKIKLVTGVIEAGIWIFEVYFNEANQSAFSPYLFISKG